MERNFLRCDRNNESFEMKLVWMDLETVEIWVKVGRRPVLVPNRNVSATTENQGECFIMLTTY